MQSAPKLFNFSLGFLFFFFFAGPWTSRGEITFKISTYNSIV